MLPRLPSLGLAAAELDPKPVSSPRPMACHDLNLKVYIYKILEL